MLKLILYPRNCLPIMTTTIYTHAYAMNGMEIVFKNNDVAYNYMIVCNFYIYYGTYITTILTAFIAGRTTVVYYSWILHRRMHTCMQ